MVIYRGFMNAHPTGEPAAADGGYEPLDLGKLLTGSLNIYRRHFGPLFVLFLLFQLPPLLILMRYVYVLQWMQQAGWPFTVDLLPPTAEPSALLGWGLALLVYWVLVFPFMFVVPARAAGLALLGRPVRIGECVKFARRRWWETQGSYALFGGLVILLYLLPLAVALLAAVEGLEVGAIVAAFFLLLVVSLITIYLIFRVVPLDGAIAFDRPQGSYTRRVVSRLVHSFRLTRGTFWYVVGVMVVTWLLMAAARYVVVTPLEWLLVVVALWLDVGEFNLLTFGLWQPPLWLLSAQMVLRTLGMVATLPFEYVVIGLLYFDLRFRREGLDIKLNLAKLADADADELSVVETDTTY